MSQWRGTITPWPYQTQNPYKSRPVEHWTRNEVIPDLSPDQVRHPIVPRPIDYRDESSTRGIPSHASTRYKTFLYFDQLTVEPNSRRKDFRFKVRLGTNFLHVPTDRSSSRVSDEGTPTSLPQYQQGDLYLKFIQPNPTISGTSFLPWHGGSVEKGSSSFDIVESTHYDAITHVRTALPPPRSFYLSTSSMTRGLSCIK